MQYNRKFLVFVLSTFLLLSTTSDIQRKLIRDGNYDIECYVYLKKLKRFNDGKEYFWFKSGSIHNSISTAGGLVLHSEYTKHYRSNQLAEKGEFDYGLKTGIWREWYENGNLKTLIEWNSGVKYGKYEYYDKSGNIEQSGSYNKNRKVNTWINHKTKDTTYYKKGSSYESKPKSKVGSFLDKIFKPKDSLERAQLKLKRKKEKVQDSINKVKRKLEKENKKTQDSLKKLNSSLKN